VPFKVFVSHSTSDTDLVIGLGSLVKLLGAEFAVAQFVVSPSEWVLDKVKKMISKCDAVVVVLTANGARSEWVALDSVGRTLKVPLIPFQDSFIKE
jgi:hypothetical protein